MAAFTPRFPSEPLTFPSRAADNQNVEPDGQPDYQVDDLVFYSNMGICRITEISLREFGGMADGRMYYTLKPLNQECVIHTPVHNPKVYMRPIITKDEAKLLIDMIPTIEAEPYHNKTPTQLAAHYVESFETHELTDLVSLTMSIYAKRREVEAQNRKFSVVDERFMKRAEELLFGELSAALNIDKEDVPDYIASRIGHAAKRLEQVRS